MEVVQTIFVGPKYICDPTKLHTKASTNTNLKCSIKLENSSDVDTTIVTKAIISVQQRNNSNCRGQTQFHVVQVEFPNHKRKTYIEFKASVTTNMLLSLLHSFSNS